MKTSLISDVAWTGEAYLGGPIKAIVYRFAGLNGTREMKTAPEHGELEWAQAGGLVVYPYYNPWAWMNGDTVAFLDELAEALRERHHLAQDTPIIATGGSMGGHAALTYTLKSRQPVSRCLAICPVADLPFHYTERPDLPRTMHSAFRSYGDIAPALEDYSPLHQAARMPRIPYLIVHGFKDQAVAKARHSDPLIQAMRGAGHDKNLTYLEVPEMAHCSPWDLASLRATLAFVKEGLA